MLLQGVNASLVNVLGVVCLCLFPSNSLYVVIILSDVILKLSRKSEYVISVLTAGSGSSPHQLPTPPM